MALTTVDAGLLNSQSQQTWRNRIINGAMVIDQRNAGASVTPTDGLYSLDRWKFQVSQTSKLTAQQNAGSVTPPAGFVKYLGVTSSSAYSVVSGDYFGVYQPIEGFNISDLGWGTANAQSVTLSFWVRSSLTGSFGGVLKNGNSTRSYPFLYTINSANTWEQKTITIPGETSGTWYSDSGLGVQVNFNLGTGSTYSGAAGAWAAANYVAPTGAVSVVGTNGATLYITGVQLEKGSTATSFDYRPYGTELALCQRYYCKFASSGGYVNFGLASAYSSTLIGLPVKFPVTMRTTPSSMDATTTFLFERDSTSNLTPSSATLANAAPEQGKVNFAVTGATTGGAAYQTFSNGTAAYIAFGAEL